MVGTCINLWTVWCCHEQPMLFLPWPELRLLCYGEPAQVDLFFQSLELQTGLKTPSSAVPLAARKCRHQVLRSVHSWNTSRHESLCSQFRYALNMLEIWARRSDIPLPESATIAVWKRLDFFQGLQGLFWCSIVEAGADEALVRINWNCVKQHPWPSWLMKLCLRFMSSAPYQYRAWNPIASNRPDTISNCVQRLTQTPCFKYDGYRLYLKKQRYSILTHWLMNIRTCLAVLPTFCKSFLKLLPLAPHPQHLNISTSSKCWESSKISLVTRNFIGFPKSSSMFPSGCYPVWSCLLSSQQVTSSRTDTQCLHSDRKGEVWDRDARK